MKEKRKKTSITIDNDLWIKFRQHALETPEKTATNRLEKLIKEDLGKSVKPEKPNKPEKLNKSIIHKNIKSDLKKKNTDNTKTVSTKRTIKLCEEYKIDSVYCSKLRRQVMCSGNLDKCEVTSP